MFCSPVAQSVVPARSLATVLMTQVLVGVLFVLGMGSGAPKRHPVELQFRLVPVSADVVGPSVALWSLQDVMRLIVCPRSGTIAGSGTELPPPPK